MFGNKENINILTSLLVSHGVRRVVVCPGSRNAPIVHNLNECASISCYPVTDERSAGFYALGLSLYDDSPVAVCVTSGTALLNLAPAVAEASYRHHGLIVISADRPEAWIGQLDGQTLRQPDAFGVFVCKCVSLPEPHDDVEWWHCNRLVNEALLAVRSSGGSSVHINVPVSEPLFVFNTEQLPCERKINFIPPVPDEASFQRIIAGIMSRANKPMVVVGQLSSNVKDIDSILDRISRRVALLAEPLSCNTLRQFDIVLSGIGNDEDYLPDFIFYVGDTVVSKRLKQFLRKAEGAENWAVSIDGEVHDTFMHLSGVIVCDPVNALHMLAKLLDSRAESDSQPCLFAEKWRAMLDDMAVRVSRYEPQYSQFAAVRRFESLLGGLDFPLHVHYANSMAVRLACIYASHYVWCNRGVNGIEGSLSTAAGFSLATDDLVFCVIGDLSFFYDQNALWNVNIRGNLRILLLNNNCGGIFYSLRGLGDSAAFGRMVAAEHEATAEGICRQNVVRYLSAANMSELDSGLAALLEPKSDRPVLLEVFTDPAEDRQASRDFMRNVLAEQ